MSVPSYFDKLKGIEEKLIKFLDYGYDEEENYENLTATLIDQNFITDPYQFKMFLHLLNKISKYHHRSINFFEKIEKLLKSFQKEMTQFYSNWTLFKIFSKSKRIILFLIEEKIITIDIDIYRTMFREKYKRLFYPEYFSPEIEAFVDKEFDENQKKKEKISNAFHKIDNFYEKRKKSDFLYNIIQQDLIEEFIIYVNKNDYYLNNHIEITIFETNNFLLQCKSVSLIILAVFFGSDQIFKYLYKNGAVLSQDLWICAIFGENPEIIQIIEEQIGPINNSTNWCFVQAIKCHHNDIANYIRENYLTIPSDQKSLNMFNDAVLHISFRCYNYLYIQKITNLNYIIFYASKYDYYNLVKLLLATNNFELYQITVFNIFLNKTPFYCAAEKDHSDVVHLLLSSEKTNQIGKYCFYNLQNFKQITIPKNITIIGENSFELCVSLSQIKFEEQSQLTTIEKNAFKTCKQLKEIEIPLFVKSIKSGAFSQCFSLTKVIIPLSVISIGSYAFNECTSLKEIKIPPSITTIGIYCFAKCSSLTNVYLPDSLTIIGEGAFLECTSLKQITIPPFVTSIGNHAFNGCSKLEQISIPSTLTSLNEGIFFECSSLKQISIPSSIKSIGNNSFEKCSSLTEIHIPSSVETVGESAFNNCSSLIKVSFEKPSSLVFISKNTFDECISLKEITIPSSIVNIAEKYFPKNVYFKTV